MQRVTIGKPFAVGMHEVTRAEFRKFVSETHYRSDNACWTLQDGDRVLESGRSWRSPGYSQQWTHPVVCVSWNDARSYVRWLSGKSGKRYRLLRESEWEYAARAGTATARFWGDSESGQCRYANGADEASGLEWGVSCNDGHARTSPVGSFPENGFGLHDMLGNVSELTRDCWTESYEKAARDERARMSVRCSHRVLRGGSWSGSPHLLRSADRTWVAAGNGDSDVGFRVARSLDASDAREFEERRRAEAQLQTDAQAARELREAIAARRRAEERRLASSPGLAFRDCEECPEMVVVPAGSYRMGSPESEEGRRNDEGPVRTVAVFDPFAVGVHEVTRAEYGRFVSETGYRSGLTCWTLRNGDWAPKLLGSWRNPGFAQTGAHPVVCVNWNDAQAYVRWLSQKTRSEYRLLSESEWEYVARAQTNTSRFWGDSDSDQCRNANGSDASGGERWGVSCDDGHAWTSPVGSYPANAFGLHDVLGNVSEWTQDCWSEDYEVASSDRSDLASGACSFRVQRGGCWLCAPSFLRSAKRERDNPENRTFVTGFRVARTLAP